MDKTRLRMLPKFDLHVHLDGSMRRETVLELAAALPTGRRLPSDLDLERALFPPARCSLEDYLRAFEVTVAVLQDEESLARAAYELCEDAAAEGVIYMEIRFAPLLHLRGGLPPEGVVEAVLAGTAQAAEDLAIRTGLILCGMKQEPLERSEATARLAAAYRGGGVVGFDLAGPERGFPPSRHRRAIGIAREAGVHVTIHAGEGCCPEQIAEALDLGAERIGHGVHLSRDAATQARVVSERIPLEVCPTSNLQISGVMDSYAEHPLKGYLDLGIPVTLNTDNRLMSRVDVTHELEAVIDAFGLTDATVETLLRNSAQAAFAPDAVKARLEERVADAFAT